MVVPPRTSPRSWRAPAGIVAAGLAACLALVPASASFANPAQAQGVAAEASDAADPSIFRIATAGFVDTFNPFISIYLTPTNIIRYMYESLVQNASEDGEPTAGLAEDWESSEDGTEWTFTLHEGLEWSDGEPITSEDPKWTYEQMMQDPVLGTANGSLVSNFESLEAPDERTLVIHLKSPQASNPGLEIPVVPKHVWSEIDDIAEYPNDADVVGSGPYLLKSYSANQSIELVANPKFWRGGPKIDGIQYIYYTNPDAQIQALRAGEVDFVTGLTSTQMEALEGTEGITTHAGQGRRFTSISINPGSETPDGVAYGTGSAALKEVEVRQALRLGIDVETLMNQVLDGQGTVATSFIPAAFPTWHLPDDDEAIVSYDPDAATALLDGAGWVPGADGIREKDGQRLTIRLLADAEDITETDGAEYIAGWLKEIGVEIDVEATDSDTIDARTSVGDYDMYFSGWSVNPDPDYQLGINLCSTRPDAEGNGGTSQDAWCNPEFDRLYAEQHSELDVDKRAELVHEMLRLHYTDVAQITLWYGKSLEAYRSDRFDGFTLMPEQDGIIANQAGYWGYLTVEPVAEVSDAAATGDGGMTGVWIGIGAVVVLGAVAAILIVRRRKSADERE
ncbi:ABC transporter substrate-binding protein [Agromyces archimandritae]|uniref:ABC transporter substrate-binding protein n=1 Tax=Agromyces archimandritae TaxID=2781962 RepID=A0A975FPV1_9MICO|nr:ABC transporter substrate-binding protein [Agromyces archimandritae]QTX05921.1 ABC transporter substrate-binding protein [Agromyces archimandritae]